MCHTDQQPWNGSLKAITRQGFKEEDGMKGFGVMNQPSSSMMRIHQAEL
jgi:hypothetical protein